MDRANNGWLFGIDLNTFAQLRNMLIHGAAVLRDVEAPASIEKHGAVDDFPGVLVAGA